MINGIEKMICQARIQWHIDIFTHGVVGTGGDSANSGIGLRVGWSNEGETDGAGIRIAGTD